MRRFRQQLPGAVAKPSVSLARRIGLSYNRVLRLAAKVPSPAIAPRSIPFPSDELFRLVSELPSAGHKDLANRPVLMPLGLHGPSAAGEVLWLPNR